ncbi:hypothetical protein C8263_08430 [Deinococcus arcticus]|uniref:Uncharacterized protein n=1 Tax=Deinococcus arcticus TaxID=2136176 RepID=A0A2T3W8H6_9DEIO|nr:hypothetical protein C8263_08430 [Deinococcus arcticus]
MPALLLPFLSGCVDPSVQAPLRPLTEAELRPYYVDAPPQPLPVYTAFRLGESYVPGGTVEGWKARNVVPLYSLRGQSAVLAAHLQPDGRLTGAAPLQTGPAETLQYTLSMRGNNSLAGGLCPVDGLKATAGVKVHLPEVAFFFYRFADVQQGAQPLTSPIPEERRLHYDLRAYDKPTSPARVDLVYVSEDLTVQGEQRCVRGYEQSGQISTYQDNIRVNFKLSRGWNALLRTETRSSAGQTHVSHITWTTVPRDVIERWL